MSAKGARFVGDIKKIIDNPHLSSTDDIISVLKDSKLSPEIKNRLENELRRRNFEQAQTRVHEEPRQAENQKTNKT